LPISATDPRYRAEYVPAQLQVFIDEARRRFALPATHVGAKGDLGHSSGYHRSRNWIINSPDSRFLGEDYSVRSSDDQRGDANWLAAVDISLPTSELVAVCRRLKAASDARDPRLHGWREFLGTVNGTSPYGWDFLGRYTKAPDRSHLWHLHLSRTRRYADTPMTAILDVMFGEDDDMALAPDEKQMLLNVHDWLFDFMRGLVTADAGTPHIKTYVPNQVLNQLLARPVTAPVTMTVADRAAIVEDLKAAILAELPDTPTVEDINAAVDKAVDTRVNGATIRTAGHGT